MFNFDTRKVLVWLAICLASVAVTVMGLKVLNDQVALFDRLHVRQTGR